MMWYDFLQSCLFSSSFNEHVSVVGLRFKYYLIDQFYLDFAVPLNNEFSSSSVA